LNLTPADIEQRVKDHEIPFERRGNRLVFRKGEIDEWASRRIMGFSSDRLAAYHEKSTRHTRNILPHETILPDLLAAGAVDSAMTSKTKASVLRDLVALAEKTGQLNDPKHLVDSLEAREELCSTAMPVVSRCPICARRSLTCSRRRSSWSAGRSRPSILAHPTGSRRNCSS